MPLKARDREILKNCLEKKPGAWNDFVDRFSGLVYHVIHHTAHLRSVVLSPEDVEDAAAEIFMGFIAKDYAVLKQFRKESSLATYLTVIARRISIQILARKAAEKAVQPHDAKQLESEPAKGKAEDGLERLEEVARLLKKLQSKDREVVRLYYLEGRSYEEISSELGVSVNTIGPILSRARKRLREDSKDDSSPGKPPLPDHLRKAK